MASLPRKSCAFYNVIRYARGMALAMKHLKRYYMRYSFQQQGSHLHFSYGPASKTNLCSTVWRLPIKMTSVSVLVEKGRTEMCTGMNVACDKHRHFVSESFSAQIPCYCFIQAYLCAMMRSVRSRCQLSANSTMKHIMCLSQEVHLLFNYPQTQQ